MSRFTIILMAPDKKKLKVVIRRPAQHWTSTALNAARTVANNPIAQRAAREAAKYVGRKIRDKFSYSRTQTKSKNNKKYSKIKPPADGESKSIDVYRKRPSPKYRAYKALTNSCTIEYTDSHKKNSGSQGIQGVNYLEGRVASGGTLSNKIGCGAMITGGEDGDLMNLMSRAMQLYNSTASATISAPPRPTNFNSSKFLLETATFEVHITNPSVVEFKMSIYDLIAKESNEELNLPADDWAEGLLAQSGGTTYHPSGSLSAASSYTKPNSKPSASKLFNLNWKVQKVTEVSLSPGRIHEHKFHLRANKIIDWDWCYQKKKLGGLTYFPMIITQGQPVGTGNSSNPVTLGYHSLEYVFTIRIRGRVLAIFPKQTWQLNNLDTDIAGQTSTIMNDDTEVAQPYVTAGVIQGEAS